MPTYEYQCVSCQHVFDLFQQITAEPVQSCPECGGRVERLMGSGLGVIFKGSGFYETDYKRKTSSQEKTNPKKDGVGDTSKKAAEKKDED